MDLMDEELRRVLAGSAEPVRPESEFANEMRRLRARDAARPPSASEIQTASRPSFRMPSAGRRAPEQRGGGEAIDALVSGFLGSVPAGIAGLATLPFAGPEKAAGVVQRVQDALALDPQTEGGVRATRGLAEAFSPMGAIPQAAGEATLEATGSPLLATGAELLADPLHLLGAGALAKTAPRAIEAAGRKAARAGRATVESLGPKAAELAESYMRRAGMMPDIFVGKSAKTWDAASNARAVEMEKAGASPRDIWSQTGNWRAPDGQWRQEISDAALTVGRGQSVVTPEDIAANEANKQRLREIKRQMDVVGQQIDKHGLSKYGAPAKLLDDYMKLRTEENDINDKMWIFLKKKAQGDEAKIGEVVQGPLLEAYPSLAEFKLKDEPPNSYSSGSFDKPGRAINISSEQRKPVFVHEGQHFVQDVEGFSPGAAPTAETARAYQDYMRYMGEAEARAAERRIPLSEAERRATFPEESYDVPIAELTDVGRQGPTTALSVVPRADVQAQQRLPQTDTPAFKEFTGGAPLVKADQASKHEFQTGKPVVIEGFSGTRRDFSEIDPALSSSGYFLSSKPVVADEYAGVYPEGMGGGSFPTGGNIQRSFVRMDNPLFVNARGASFNRIDTRGIPGFGLPMSNTDMLNHWAKQQGYDGVIYKDLRDSIARPRGQNTPASNVYVAFNRNYVKSAIGNRGTFDITKSDMTKAEGGLVGGSMSYTNAADVIADKLVRQGMEPGRAFNQALRMSDAAMKAGGAVLMNEGGEANLERQMRERVRSVLSRPEPMRKTWDGPMPNRPVVNGIAQVSREELEDFRRKFGANMTLRDLLNADKGRGPSAANPAARGQNRAEAPATPAGQSDPYQDPSRALEGAAAAQRAIAQPGRDAVEGVYPEAALLPVKGLPQAARAVKAMLPSKLLREHPSISPERRQMLKEMEDYISGINRGMKGDDLPLDPKMQPMAGRIEPGFAGGGKAGKTKALVGIDPALRGAARAEARLKAKKAAEEAAIAARTPVEKAVVEKFGQKQEQEAARAKKVEQLSADAPQREVKSAGRRVKVQPDVYRQMAEQQGEEAVLRAARAGEHLKPTPQGYVGAPRTVTNPQALGGMRRAMDKDFADSVEAVRLADPERLGTWYDRAKQGIAESSEPYQLPRVLEQHGVYSAGVSPESELGFSLKHLNTRALGEPGMAYRGAPMRNLDEAVAQNRAAKMGFKIGEYMEKNDPRVPNAGLFGVNDFRRAQGMGYTDPAGKPWKAGVSDTMHPFMDLETALQVDRANKGALGGRTDWAGPHIQEVPWVYGKAQDLYGRGKKGRFGGDELEGIKRSLVEANNTARDYMYKHAASATHEAVPGASLGHVSQVLGMTPEQKAAYGATGRWDLPAPEASMSDMPGVGAGNRDVLYGALGLRQLPSRQGSGLYINSLGEVETNPMTIARPLMDFPTGGGGLMAPLSRKAMEATEGLRALLDAQEAGAFNLPNTMSSVKDKNSLVLDTRRRNPNRLGDPSAGVLPTSEQLSQMGEELSRLQSRRMDVGPLRDPGFGVSATNRGAVVFPYKPDMDPAEAARALKSVSKNLTNIFPADPQMSLSTMGYVPGVGKRGEFGPQPTAPFSGEATIDKLMMLADLPQDVALSLGESEALRAQIREKALRDAKLGGTRRDIQETRRFFSEADWPKAVEMIRKGMTPAAALAALGYSASAMAEQAP